MITLKSAIGVEIRGDELLLVCLKRGIRDISVAGHKIVEGFSTMSRSELRHIVHQFFRENRVRRENVVLGIPRDQVVIRFLTLPSEVKDNLAQVMKFQAESFDPSEENGSYFDYAVLDETAGEDGRLSLMLVQIKKARLDEYVALFREIQVPLRSIQISSVAISNLLRTGQESLRDKSCFIFSFTAGYSELLGVRKGRLAYSRLHTLADTVPGHEELIRHLEDGMSVSRIPADEVAKVLVAGPNAEALRQTLASEIGEVALLSASSRLRSPSGMGSSLANLATPIGLGLEGLNSGLTATVNLLPQSQRVKRSRYAYALTYALLLVMAFMTTAYFGREYYQERLYLAELEREIAALKPQVDEVDAIRQESLQLEQKIAYLEQIFCGADLNLELLNELTASIPDDTYLQYMSNREGEIMLQGLSGSASALLPLLSRSRYLKTVEPMSPFTRDPVSGKERFNLKARVEAQPCK